MSCFESLKKNSFKKFLLLIEETCYIKLTLESVCYKMGESIKNQFRFHEQIFNTFGIFSYLYFVIPYLVFRKKSSFALFYARAHSSSSPGLQSTFSAREHASFGLGLWPTET